MTGGKPGKQDYTAREILLAAAARAVLSALREPVEQRRLSPTAVATLRVLEAALDPYSFELPAPLHPPDK